MSIKKIECIDLFCGAGGLTYGLQKTGINVVAGYDIDPACKYPFEANNSSVFKQEDVTKLKGSALQDLFTERAQIRLLAGCAPCQPFSTYSHRYKTIGTARWALLKQFARLVIELRPEYVVMENVPSVTKHSVFEDFENSLKKNYYYCSKTIVDCSKYGLPQARRRTVFLASLRGPISLNPHDLTEEVTVADAISRSS